MRILAWLNLALAFFLELAALYFLWAWGFHGQGPALGRWILGFGLPVLFAAAWGRWAAPKSVRRCKGSTLVAVKVLLFTPAAVALGLRSGAVPAAMFVGVVLAQLALERAWRTDDSGRAV